MLVPAQLFIFNVITVAVANEEYVASSLLDIVGLSLLPFIGFSLGLYLIARYLTAADQRTFVWILLPLTFLLVWLQSQILVWDYGGLTGATIDWAAYPWQGIADISVWILAITAVIVFRKKIASTMLYVAVVIAGLQLALNTYSSSTRLLVDAEIPAVEEDLEEIMSFSDDQNVIHIIIDGFQSDILDELLQLQSFSERYEQHFEGFTIFPETLSVFPYTQFSVPVYLSAEMYRNDTQKETFIDETLEQNSIMAAARENGFQVDLAVNGAYFTRRHASLPHDNIFDIDNVAAPQDKFSDAALLWDISLFRAVPHFLKRHVYNDQSWLISRAIIEDVRQSYAFFRHTEFLNLMTETMDTERPEPTYKLIHVKHAHRPMIVNEDCGFAGRTLPDTRRNLAIQSACALDTVIELFERLKSLDIYDDALILIHADHGGWVPTLRDGASIPIGEEQAPGWVLSLASPLLMVKPPGDRSELSRSRALTSLIDIPDTVSTVMGWDSSFGYRSVFDVEEGEPRERRSKFYFWHADEWSNDFTQPIIEYSIQGSHFESDWIVVDIHESEQGLRMNDGAD